MKLIDKANENIELTEDCLKKNHCINAIAGRPYYAVLQNMLHILEENSVNLDEFIQEQGLDEKEHSTHDITRLAFIELAKNKGNMNTEFIKSLSKLNNLKYNRILADYKKRKFIDSDISRIVDDAKEVIGEFLKVR